jgi:hypothetical protein
MGTRQPGHDHGFDDVCTTACGGYKGSDDKPCACPPMGIDPSCPRHSGDRGEFGMPTIGGWRVSRLGDGLTDERHLTWRYIDEPEPNNLIVSHNGINVAFGDSQGYEVPATTDDARYIMDILPDLLKHFLTKNTQYARAQTGHDLGLKGIVPDINRKTSALITRIWDRQALEPYEGEDSTEELIEDLIGHLLLMLAKMRDS